MHLAVVCASGIGDALIFHTVSASLEPLGIKTTTFSDHLLSFGPWLAQNFSSSPQPPVEEIEKTFSHFDAIFLQHDNSPKAFKIHSLKMPVFSFYGAHLLSKHGPLSEEKDYVCDRSKTMVENLARAIGHFFGAKNLRNQLYPPKGLIHRSFKRRIAIHPTASQPEKMWPREKFLKVAAKLKQDGYDPVFTVSPRELHEWGGPLFPTLADLASFIYESGAFLGNDSGTAHLASLLKIPHLVIGGDGTQMPLWKTGWHPGASLTPPLWLMRLKILRKNWQHFISEKKVIKNFKERVLRN